MKKIFFLTILSLFPLVLCGAAAEISRITLTELYEQADRIVLGEVTRVVQKGDKDEVTITVELYLKGNNPERQYTFSLIPRGKKKDFDPALEKGDAGVFFLKEKWGGMEKAYWGSMAVFPKNHFELTEGKARTQAAGPLSSWRDYRVKLGQMRDVAEYERGFIKGFNSPDFLEKGPPDFRMGLSDGKLARKGIVPAW